ncbi:MAG: hypothetical protein KAU95_02365, partial [Candidatus Aenigmarchaeota archaeon]|nr:hypothetical protein [Candidatus Aenigmarchaeota archaeon]
MRNFPNLEGAVKFASQYLTGPLALDIKKLLWDVHVGVYESMEKALIDFSIKWKPSFRAFPDAINSVIYSLYTGGNRRMELLDESVDIILTALDERANSYIINLKTPVTMINALGILLPTLVLTMMPVATIFLKDTIPPYAIFGFYDIVLPILLVFIIKNVLDQRVITMPEPDLSMHPDLPPDDTFKVGNLFVRCYIPPLLILIPFLYFWYLNWNLDLYGSFLVIAGFFISLSVYSYLNSFQKIKIRHEIIEIEEEFRDILFGLGQEMDRGIPLEVGFEKIFPTLKGSYSANMITSILTNMKYEGMTLERAIFDEKIGAVLKFPSKLIY